MTTGGISAAHSPGHVARAEEPKEQARSEEASGKNDNNKSVKGGREQ